MSKPIIGISTCFETHGLHNYHQAGDKYVSAILKVFDAVPLLIPSIGPQLGIQEILDTVDGLLFTGSYSNINPKEYNGTPSLTEIKHDRNRDETTIPLIRHAVDKGVPVFAICRGFQEMNVAFGGSLHQRVHEVEGLNDHREDDSLDLSGQYAFAHDINIAENGHLSKITNSAVEQVNSVHWQGIDQLGQGLEVEAKSPDGLIEAFRVKDAPFALAVQWHPEYNLTEIPFYYNIFESFSNAVQSYKNNKKFHDNL